MICLEIVLTNFFGRVDQCQNQLRFVHEDIEELAEQLSEHIEAANKRVKREEVERVKREEVEREGWGFDPQNVPRPHTGLQRITTFFRRAAAPEPGSAPEVDAPTPTRGGGGDAPAHSTPPTKTIVLTVRTIKQEEAECKEEARNGSPQP